MGIAWVYDVLNMAVEPLTYTPEPQYNQQPGRQQWPGSYAPSAAHLRNLAKLAVAHAAVLGSRTVVEAATQSLNIHGQRAPRRAQVCLGETDFCVFICTDYRLIERGFRGTCTSF